MKRYLFKLARFDATEERSRIASLRQGWSIDVAAAPKPSLFSRVVFGILWVLGRRNGGAGL